MPERTGCRQRRREPRHAVAGRITWSRHGSDLTFSARLRDASGSGVSFLAATPFKPLFGEEIELISPDRSRQRYRVTRIARYDDESSLIACRATSASEGVPSWSTASGRRVGRSGGPVLSAHALGCIAFVITILAVLLLLTNVAK